MQPLGSPELIEAYHARIAEDHDYWITAEILDTEENVLGQAEIVDGQINLLPDAIVHRTAQATLSDPDRTLGLDGSSVFAGSAAASRMLRIRHTVEVAGYGLVSCTPFVGPFTRVNRNGDTIEVEAQDKMAFSLYGTRPYTVPRGMNAMLAIRALLTNRAGESRFRLPSGVRFRLRRPYSVSWPDESSVAVRVQEIAHAAGMQGFYSCDGYFTARAYSTIPVLEFGGDGIPITAAPPSSDSDFTTIVNYARVEAEKIVRVAEAEVTHPFSAANLGRNGVPWYRPALAELSAPQAPDKPTGNPKRPEAKAEWQKYAQEMEDYNVSVRATQARAEATAAALLKNGLTQDVNLAFSCVPVFHLDYADPIRVTTEEGSQIIRLTNASIPLRDGDMTVGLIKRVSRPGRIAS